MIYDGIESLSVDDATGELVIQTPWGEMRDAAPVAYQDIDGIRKKIDVSFRLIGEKSVGFALGDYDPNFMLTLDPGYSTFLGGNNNSDSGSGIAVDGSSNAYVTGYAYSTDFPTENAYDNSHNGGADAFVTKLNASGNISYSTYLGGSDNDEGYGIAVDDSGNAYVTGKTASTDFPTHNAYDDSYNGGDHDAFVAKLNASGTSLVYSTYLGGFHEPGVNSSDYGRDITVDSSGNAYVTGITCSTDFPTHNAYDDSYNGGRYDTFVTKLNASGTSLVYSTYLGGSGDEYSEGIAVDGSGNAYVTGVTSSTDFPIHNAYDDSYSGGDAFVTKFNASGNISYSTYLGGSSSEEGEGIVVDGSGNAYVTGTTLSTDFPTINAYDDSHNGGSYDVFVTKLDVSGTSLVYSTYLGGSDWDLSSSIAVDSSGNTYVTGYTLSTNFPTINAYDNSYNGSRDAFVTKLDASGTSLAYSTYLGGSDWDRSSSIAVDGSSNAYVTGKTSSTNFPTLNPYQGSYAGNGDAFVASYFQDGTLPVELSLFTATTSAGGVIIRWRTETEVGNIGFRIYRSEEKDGNYTKVASISGGGNSASKLPESIQS